MPANVNNNGDYFSKSSSADVLGDPGFSVAGTFSCGLFGEYQVDKRPS